MIKTIRCPECGSEEVLVSLNPDGDFPHGECFKCGAIEDAVNFSYVNAKKLPPPLDHTALGMAMIHTPITEKIQFWRETFSGDNKGQLFTNVPLYCDDGTGYEWGYAGSGPTRFALNILEAVLRSMEYDGALCTSWHVGHHYSGCCYRMAWKYRHDFKNQFVAPAHRNGGQIPYAIIQKWLRERIGDLE